MKTKKYILFVSIMVGILIFASGCGKSMEERIGEKVSEKVLEKATGGDVDVDTKDGVSIETEEGSMKTGEDLGWPESSMAQLPEPNAKVVSITEVKEEDAITVMLAFDKKDGGSKYMEELIDIGYVERSTSKSDQNITFTGVKEDGTAVIFSYEPDGEFGNIMFYRDNDGAKEFFEEDSKEEEEIEEIDPENSMDWPEDSMDKLPELKAEISNVSKQEGQVAIGFKKVSKKDILAYIEKVKSSGFDANPMETVSDNFISYTALNSKEETITINWSDNGGSIRYIKK